MARRVILSDDLTGDELEDVETHVFMIDNVFYEVDFGKKSMETFEKAMGRFIKVARETRRITATAKGEATDAEKRRQWAKANGFEVSERGRLSEEINAAYEKAHSNGTNQDNSDTSSESTEGSEKTSDSDSES
jgi:hypothetical protein